MDWEGIATAYLDRERRRLGIPSREELATKRAAEQRAAQLAASQLETAGVLRDKTRMDIETQPELRRLQGEAAVARAEAAQARAERTPTAPSSEFERFAALPPEKQAEILKLRKAWGTADDRPASTTILPFLTGEGYIDRRTGNPLSFTRPPTADMANRAQAQKRAIPVLADLGSRALSLNKSGEGGFVDRATGSLRRVGGGVGLDPAADLYTTGVRGFVPLIARAVGHVGVLTELDVQRTEDLFPRIGDAENVTREKLARVQRIVTGQEPLPFEFEQPEYNEQGITQPGTAPAPVTAPVEPQRPPGVPPEARWDPATRRWRL